MKNQQRAYGYALITVLFWSTVATAFKISLRNFNNVQLLAVANLISFIVFLAMLAGSRRLFLLRELRPRDYALSAAQGLLNPFGYYLIIFKSYSLLPAQVAQPANFIWPLVLMLLSVPLLKQPLKLTGILGLVISFAGVFVLATQGHFSDFKIVEPLGITLAMFTSVIWSLFWIINVKDTRDDLLKLFLSFGFSLIYVAILLAFRDDKWPSFSGSWIAAVYVGLFEMGIAFVLWLKALKLSDSAGKVANLIYLTPFLSLIAIHFVLGEKLFSTSVIGLCLIIAGIMTGRIKNKS
ncbi:MAG TPA: DMT family transporter [Bacteroidales bacterium]|nr:DMT family transporter [Bacteroidales bacterium]